MRSNSATPSRIVTSWHQQVFALDAKYHAQRAVNTSSLGMMYIRRRSQLLHDKSCKDPELQSRYLKLRSELLRRRYGTCLETASLPSEKSFEIKGKGKIANKRTAERFAGVHHVLDQHSAAISMLKFANNDRSRFCCASHDGTISICEATSTPPKVVALLQGHQKGVTAVDWSMSNDLLVSSSLDSTVRLWKIHQDSKTDCLRVTLDQSRAELLCCVFVPTNNNFVLAGNSLGLLQTLNVSTGKFTKNGIKIGGRITALSCGSGSGSIVWAGNDRGNIISFNLEPGLGKLTKLRRMEGTGGTITSLSWRPWLSKDFPWPTLLVSSACNAVLLYRVADDQGYLVSCKRYPIKHRQYFIRSTFCPQMSTSLIATGSDDGTIYLFDSARDGKFAQVNRLLGHSSATLTLSFNYDESLLASGDNNGLVILWRNNQSQA